MSTSVTYNLTHESLLFRLQNVDDSRAWERFHQTYKGIIASYARRRGCSDSMVKDVIQETLITLTRVMPTFQYRREKGRFRSFLLAIVRSRIIDAIRREQKYVDVDTNSTDTDAEVGASLADNTAGRQNWETEWDKEWEEYLLALALERVKGKVSPHIFESFRLYVLEGNSADVVAQRLKIPKDNIYEHRRRLVSMLRDEVTAIRSEMGE